LYYGLADGGLYSRSFDSGTGVVGAQQTVILYDDPDTGQRMPFTVANLTGMFYDTATHRIYYTLAGSSGLFHRYFTPESHIVGAQQLTAVADGVSFGSAAGMTLAGGTILYGSTVDGALRAAPFAGGRVTGSSAVVSSDGTWRSFSLFVPNG
jgi:hypothetical protein